jgi:phage-related protein
MFLSLNGAKFRILYYKQFLGRRCGIRKNYWPDDDYIWQDVRVVCALFVLHITVFEVRT